MREGVEAVNKAILFWRSFIQWIGGSGIIVLFIAFMVIGSINFSLYYFILKGKIYRLYDNELILFIVLLAASCALCTYCIAGTEQVFLTGEPPRTFTLSEAIRAACFQVVSAQTSTGFSTVDYDIWPYPSQVILLIVMYFGGMAGSTAGGMKIIRLYMLFKITQYKIESLFIWGHFRSFNRGSFRAAKSCSLLFYSPLAPNPGNLSASFLETTIVRRFKSLALS